MSQVTATTRAHFFDPDHSITGIAQALDVRLIVGPEKARPARPGIKLRARSKQGQAAKTTRIDSILVIIEEYATEGCFRPVLKKHVALFFAEVRRNQVALLFSRWSQVKLAHKRNSLAAPVAAEQLGSPHGASPHLPLHRPPHSGHVSASATWLAARGRASRSAYFNLPTHEYDLSQPTSLRQCVRLARLAEGHPATDWQ